MAYQANHRATLNRSKNNCFRFGSFNHSRKLGKETIELFSLVMDTIPNSQLVLKSISFIEEQAVTQT